MTEEQETQDYRDRYHLDRYGWREYGNQYEVYETVSLKHITFCTSRLEAQSETAWRNRRYMEQRNGK